MVDSRQQPHLKHSCDQNARGKVDRATVNYDKTTQLCARILKAAYRGRHANKHLSRDTDTSPHTAKKYLSGEIRMSQTSFFSLAENRPDLAHQLIDAVHASSIERVRSQFQKTLPLNNFPEQRGAMT